MGGEVELVSDGEGLAVIGESSAVDRFLLSSGLDLAPSRRLDLQRLHSVAASGGIALHAATEVAANSGRWVKLTAESAVAVHKYGLMPTKVPGVSHAMIGDPGNIHKWLQISQAPVLSPVALTSLSTMLQQYAMQQQIEEIIEYLQIIDQKLDDVLRAQKDAVLADMIGVDLMIDDAMAVRDEVGRVSDITWSKVQSTGATLARTQAYALRQLDAIAERLRKKSDVGEIAKATAGAERDVREWLGVIARTVQLQDAVWILELDRVTDASPEQVEDHRAGLRSARSRRLELIGQTTASILSQMNETIRLANSRVLLNPFDSPAAVRSSDRVAVEVVALQQTLGIRSGRESDAARRWRQAAAEARDKVVAVAAGGLSAVGRFGATGADHATRPFRAIDRNGDGIPDRPRAAEVVENAGSAIAGASADAWRSLRNGIRPRHERPGADKETNGTAAPGDDSQGIESTSSEG